MDAIPVAEVNGTLAKGCWENPEPRISTLDLAQNGLQGPRHRQNRALSPQLPRRPRATLSLPSLKHIGRTRQSPPRPGQPRAGSHLLGLLIDLSKLLLHLLLLLLLHLLHALSGLHHFAKALLTLPTGTESQESPGRLGPGKARTRARPLTASPPPAAAACPPPPSAGAAAQPPPSAAGSPGVAAPSPGGERG